MLGALVDCQTCWSETVHVYTHAKRSGVCCQVVVVVIALTLVLLRSMYKG